MTNDEIKIEIQKLREQQKELQRQGAELGKEIASLKRQFATDWRVGDRYETSKGVFEIAYLALDDNGRIELYQSKVRKIKKDGTPSQAGQYPYGLENARRIG